MKAHTLLILILAWTTIAGAADYYVAVDGDDTNGNGTHQSPWGTIGHGITQLAGGDTLIVKPGVYYDKDNFIKAVPAGSAGNFTTVRAEEPHSVTIKNSIGLSSSDYMAELASTYTHVDGFVFDMEGTRYPSSTISISGDYNKLTRSIIRRAGDIDTYGGWIRVGGSYNLVEDVAGVGAARYGFATGGSTATAAYNIFRRVVGRVDYSNSTKPKAAFAVLGNSSGYGVHDVLLQNCVALDGHQGPTEREDTYGGFYFSKNVSDITLQGSIVLNNEATHAGYFVKGAGGRNITLEHSIAWGVYGSPNVVGIRAGGSNGPLTLDHVTVGATTAGYYHRSSNIESLTNSLFYNNTDAYAYSYGWDRITHNAFNNPTHSEGENAITDNVVLSYILRQEPGSSLDGAGNDGMSVGADVTVQYGVSGALWGEPGYDQRTSVALWPWRFEDSIKDVFRIPNQPPAGNVPSVNPTVRGFTVDSDQFSQPMTLTRYIWQYLGNQIPGDIYSGSGNSDDNACGNNTVPVAVADSFQTNEDSQVTIDVLANDQDPDQDRLSIVGLYQPENGSLRDNGQGKLVYIPNNNFHGTDTFSYTIFDGRGGVSSVEVSVTVYAVDDQPVANNDAIDVDQDSSVTFNVNDNDSGLGDVPIFHSVVVAPANGTVQLNGTGVFTYEPYPGYVGSDSFTYQITDSDGDTAVSNVAIVVHCSSCTNSQNSAPQAADDIVQTDEDTPLSINVLANDQDLDQDPLSITGFTQPANGSLSGGDQGVLVYSPNADFNGTDTFSYTISDGHGGDSSARVTITVSAVDDRPVANNDTIIVDEDASITFDINKNDTGLGDLPISNILQTEPLNGSLTLNSGGSVTYTPNAGFTGADSFTYLVNDGDGDSDVGNVAVTVNCVQSCAGQSATLMISWTPSTAPGVFGYYVYHGVSSNVHSDRIWVDGRDTTSITYQATGSQSHYFSVTAVNAAGESIKSQESSITL